MMCASFGRARRPASSARQGLRVDAVGLQLDGVQPRRAGAARAACGRTTGARRPPRRRGARVLEQERVGLHRAVRDEHALGLDAMPVGDPGAQPRIADRGAVGGRARPDRSRTRAGPRRAGRPRRRCRATARRARRRSWGRSELARPRRLGDRAARRSRGSARAPCARSRSRKRSSSAVLGVRYGAARRPAPDRRARRRGPGGALVCGERSAGAARQRGPPAAARLPACGPRAPGGRRLVGHGLSGTILPRSVESRRRVAPPRRSGPHRSSVDARPWSEARGERLVAARRRRGRRNTAQARPGCGAARVRCARASLELVELALELAQRVCDLTSVHERQA